MQPLRITRALQFMPTSRVAQLQLEQQEAADCTYREHSGSSISTSVASGTSRGRLEQFPWGRAALAEQVLELQLVGQVKDQAFQ